MAQGVKINKQHRINDEITLPQMMLIDYDGQSRGIVSNAEAKRLARLREMDLVEISPKANPPVVKILDYNKFRYEQEKRSRLSARGSRNPQLKEMRLSFSIDDHDIEVKARRAREFLSEGHFVRVFINLRGRENVFPEKAKKILESFCERVEATIEQPVSYIGKKVQLIIKPKRNAKNQNS